MYIYMVSKLICQVFELHILPVFLRLFLFKSTFYSLPQIIAHFDRSLVFLANQLPPQSNRLPPNPPTHIRVFCLAELDVRIAQDPVTRRLNGRLSTKFFVILQESCRDKPSLEELCDGVRKEDHSFNYRYTRGAMEKTYNSDLYTIANPGNPTVSFHPRHLYMEVTLTKSQSVYPIRNAGALKASL